MDIESLKYPIGKFDHTIKPDKALINTWISTIEEFPNKIRDLVSELSKEELNWKYRPEGWCIKEVVHHCVDSHINSIVRFKLALTEDSPTIRTYFEDRWVRLEDAQEEDLSASLMILKGLHHRWTILLKSLNDDDLRKEFVHPDHDHKLNVAENIGLYAWHCDHHRNHIENALRFKGKWN